MSGCCINCGEELEGDGYSKVLHCWAADEEKVDVCEPDSNPVYCNQGDVHEH